ncbi:aldo/keto reductase [Corallococcus sp. bb12-1]|uniref:aldo/keto reductase n=1 Tax=Corallococcus sp. bb12-1 TaxID=2996784 RepID=UPI002271F3FF|nr:aldo/keto reductase [Corallococcus sp. bb12-1]MCY1039798.1 aldo/keto reductase [Corallococcus sp. bb12-1]
MTSAPARLLNDGHRIPQLGFGTWPLDDDEASVAVESALKAGYRLIDTASRYGNETGVGRGLRAAGLPRAEVFVTTKLRGQDHGFDATLRAFDASARRLGLDGVDLYLIHWPLPAKQLYVDTWRAFIRLRDEGRVRSIGVSNFQPHHLQKLVDETGVVPSVNQVELHPDLAQPVLVADSEKRGIVLEAWSPLGRGGDVLKNDAIVRMAKKHGRSPAQVILRWHVERGVIAIPKSKDPERMRQNLDIFDFTLDAEDLAALQKLDRGHRMGGDPDTNTEE